MDKRTKQELLEIVKNNYSKIAEGFNETREKYLWPELFNLLAEIKDGDRIFDAGCGNGRLLKAFEGKKIDYLGVDSSERLIDLARQRYPEINFKTADVLDLGKISEYNFDYVISIAVLHHLPGKDLRVDALRQLRNKIKQDGKIILTVWNMWSQNKFKKLIWKFFLLKILKKHQMDFGDILFDWKKDQDKFLSQRYYHAFTFFELKKIIKKADLKIKRLYKDKYNYYLVLTK